jgi:HK97 family phage prohead protease
MGAGAVQTESRLTDRPPRDGLWRIWVPGGGDDPASVELRETSVTPKLSGHFAVFNRWTEISSFFEGNFMERIAPGAFTKTMKEQRNSMRVLLNHGKDPSLGMQPLGSINSLREDSKGAKYEVNVFRGVPELVMEGLRANQYGASFKFRVTREDIRSDVKPTRDNPKGLDERTIQEAQVFEFGPVTFPAYGEATAGLRSLTDDFLLQEMASVDPELVRMAAGGADLRDLFARRTGISVPRSPEQKQEEEREDAGPLAEMLVLGAAYCDEQVEPDERAKMEAIMASIQELDSSEASENESDEDEENAADTEGEDRGENLDTTTDADEGTSAEGSAEEEGVGDHAKNAAPEPRSTPLIGPAGSRESWRL